MKDDDPFEGIREFLATAVHPEIHHHRANRHPGANWFLKTICPDPQLKRLDSYRYGHSWRQLSLHVPELVLLTDVAFDWSGRRIAYSSSIWLNRSIDVEMIDNKPNGLILSIRPNLQGEVDAIDVLLQLIELSDSDDSDWFRSCTRALEDQVVLARSTQRRKAMRVLDGTD